MVGASACHAMCNMHPSGETKWHVVVPQLVSALAFMLLPLLMRVSVVFAMVGLMVSTGTMPAEMPAEMPVRHVPIEGAC